MRVRARVRRLRSVATASQAGFTLIELLIVITLMGALTGAILAGLITSMRASEQVQKAIPGPQASQNLNSWLTADIESAIPSTIDTTVGAAMGCSSAPETGVVQNAVRFDATDPANPTTLYSVAYRYHVTDKTLWRTFCVKNQTPSHHAALIENLPAAPSVLVTDNLVTGKKSISMSPTVVIKDKFYTFTLFGSVRTPKDPPVTVPISNTTLPPKSPCAYTAPGTPIIGRNPAIPGSKKPLSGSVTFTVTTNLTTGTGSTCEDIWVKVNCSNADCSDAGEQVLRLAQQAANTHVWSSTFTCPAATPAELVAWCSPGWKASGPGEYTITVLDGYVAGAAITDPPINQGTPVSGPTYRLTVRAGA